MRNTIEKLDYATRDYEGFRELMINKLQELMPEYTDIRQSDAGIVILELNAICLDILSYYIDSIANECFISTAEQRSNILKLSKMLGYTPRFATSAHFKQIFVKSDPEVDTLIRKGTKVKTYSDVGNSEYYTVTSDLLIPKGYRGDEKHTVNGKEEYRFTADVIHGVYVNEETLTNKSPVTKGQKYPLSYAPALVDENFQVHVTDTVSGLETWNRVDTFAGSDLTSKVYVVEINDFNQTSILFGDDLFGAIPKNAKITCSYYVGGGSVGNVGVNTINTMEDLITNIAETYNVEQVTYGYDPETVDEIRVNAPLSFRTRWGALTVKDFAGVTAQYFPDVVCADARKAQEFSLKPQLDVDDIIIYILTQGEVDLEASAKPNFYIRIPSGYYNNSYYTRIRQEVRDFFNSEEDYVEIEGKPVDSGRKLAGTRNVYVNPADIKELTLNVTLLAEEYYNPSDIMEDVIDYLKTFFKLGNLKFNQDVSLVDLTREITSNVNGVRYLSIELDTKLDNNGEDHNSYYDYINRDLISPTTGTILVLSNVNAIIRTR